ncbi:MAG: hypothetical protein WA705_27760 [Candidatus Ozemobacteraceae bacterium]
MKKETAENVKKIIDLFGKEICDSPSRLEDALKKLCPTEGKAEIAILVAAAKENVVKELLSNSEENPLELVLPRLNRRLGEECGFRDDLVAWAIEIWLIALGLKKESEGKGLKNSPKSPKPSKAQSAVKPQTHEEVFQACGKEWCVGQNNIDWNNTQAWIKALGKSWQAPTRAELKELYDEVRQKSPLKNDWAWAELRDSSSAWCFSFHYGTAFWGYCDSSYWYYRALAVRFR